MKLLKIIALLLAGCGVAGAQGTATNSFNYSVGAAIPDNDVSGVADIHTVVSPIYSITAIQVLLNISGGFNGDYYAYLMHDPGFTVLLNRVGRTASSADGYADGGFTVTFDATAVNGDIHNYRPLQNPNGGSLTGVWQPDARNVSPSSSLDTTPRSAWFSSFNGLDASGGWTLFVADVSSVGTGTFTSWGFNIVGLIPEPASGTLLLFGGGAFWLFRKIRFH